MTNEPDHRDPQVLGRPVRTQEQAVLIPAFLFLLVVLGYFLLGAGTTLVSSERREILGHVAASGLFVVVGAGIIATRRRSVSLRTALLVGIALSLAFELLQTLNPARAVQLKDIAVGLAGVLCAGLAIEAFLRRIRHPQGVRWLAALAALAGVSMILLAAVFGAPKRIEDLGPGASGCPATFAERSQLMRLELDLDVLADGCLQTSHGGVALVGSDPEGSVLHSDSVLLTSEFEWRQPGQFFDGSVSLRASIQTNDFRAEDKGAILELVGPKRGVLRVLATGSRLEVVMVTGDEANDLALLYAPILVPDTPYVIDVRLAGERMEVWLGDTRVGSSWVTSAWRDRFEGPLRLYIGNIENRTLGFGGAIDWVEVAFGDEGSGDR